MNRQTICSISLLGALFTLTLTLPVRAQTVLTNQHTDIGINYTLAGGWDLHVHDETNDIEYAPGDALLSVLPGAQSVRPASSAFDFIGVSAGQNYYRLPQTNDPSLLYLGFGAEELDPDGLFEAWDPGNGLGSAKWLQVSLVSVQHTTLAGSSGTGAFSVWLSDLGGPVKEIASADGVGSDDHLFVLAGGHEHRNFGFTEPGIYDVEIAVTGQLSATSSLSTSPTATYRFVVAAPEPSALALGLLGAPLILRRRTQRTKR